MGLPRGTWYVAGILAILGSLAAGGLVYLEQTEVEPSRARNAEVQLRFLPDYLDDVAYLKREAFFRVDRNAAKDASGLFNPRLDWLPALEGDGPAAEKAAAKSLVDEESRGKLLRMRSEWIQHPGAFRRARPDFSALKAALAFDHWDVERSGPIEALVQSGAFVPPSALPMPDAMEVTALVKLRLIKAMELGDWLQALRESRHMARLMFTTESLQMQLASLALLDAERRAYRHYVEQNMIDEAAWQPIDRNFTRRAHRALWATRGYLRVLTPSDTFRAVFLEPGRDAFGLCAAANEQFPIVWSLRPLVVGRWPGQADLSGDYERLDKLWEIVRGRCRARYLNALVKSGNLEAHLPVPLVFRLLPWSRQLFGIKLATLNFMGFEAYDVATGEL